MSDLRNKVIRLAHAKPELRKHLLPLLKEASSLADMLSDEDFIFTIHLAMARKIPRREPKWVKNLPGGEFVTMTKKVLGGELSSMLRQFATSRTVDMGQQRAERKGKELLAVYISARRVSGPPAKGANFLFETRGRKMYGGEEGPGGSPMLAKWSAWSDRWWVAPPKRL